MTGPRSVADDHNFLLGVGDTLPLESYFPVLRSADSNTGPTTTYLKKIARVYVLSDSTLNFGGKNKNGNYGFEHIVNEMFGPQVKVTYSVTAGATMATLSNQLRRRTREAGEFQARGGPGESIFVVFWSANDLFSDAHSMRCKNTVDMPVALDFASACRDHNVVVIGPVPASFGAHSSESKGTSTA